MSAHQFANAGLCEIIALSWRYGVGRRPRGREVQVRKAIAIANKVERLATSLLASLVYGSASSASQHQHYDNFKSRRDPFDGMAISHRLAQCVYRTW